MTIKQSNKPLIKIGYLKIMDHLILGISHEMNQGRFKRFILQPICFESWDDLQEALQNQELDGACIFLTLAMQMKQQGLPLKCLLLTHRDDIALVSQKNIQKISQLKGKTIGLAHNDSTHRLFLQNFLEKQGISLSEIRLKTIEPFAWFDAFRKGEIAAYFGSETYYFKKIKSADLGTILYEAKKDKGHVNGVFVVHKDIPHIEEAQQELTEKLVMASFLLHQNPQKASFIGAKFLKKSQDLILKHLTANQKRTEAWSLVPHHEEFLELENYGKSAGLLDEGHQHTHTFIEDSTVKKAYKKIKHGLLKDWHQLARWKKIFQPLGFILALLLLWEGLVRSQIIDPKLLPAPSQVSQALYAVTKTGQIFQHIVASLTRVFGGYFLAVLSAIPMGLLLGTKKTLRQTTSPLIHILRTISPIAWVPLAILWFGIGNKPAIFIIFMTAFFPILLATSLAIKEVEPSLIKVGQNFGFSERQLLQKIILPAIAPNIITGLRISLGISWTIIVAAEMVGMNSGLGFMILDARNFLNTDLILAGMFVIGLIGLVLDWSLQLLEKKLKNLWGIH